jgi:pimeloyl-ACP methyl ester carboxylesterase
LVIFMRSFDYNASIPLDSQIVDQGLMLGYAREKIVFTGCTGERIAGWFALPKVTGSPHPCILVLHGAGTNKDAWWRAENPTGPLVPRLLENGFAVFMLDAGSFGEHRIPADLADSANAAIASNWRHGFGDLIYRTTADYRRALDYLETRTEINSSYSAVFGYSMGGVAATNLVAAEPRLKAGVICVAPPMIKPNKVLSPSRARFAAIVPEIDARALGGKPLLFLMACQDIYFSAEEAAGLVALVPGTAKQLKFFESGHILPHSYIDDTVSWFRQHLRP